MNLFLGKTASTFVYPQFPCLQAQSPSRGLEQAPACQRLLLRFALQWWSALRRPWNIKRQHHGELTADSGPAFKVDLPPHQFHQMPHDGQSKSRATKAPRGAGTALPERLEDPRLLIRRNADAAVLHLKAQRGLCAIPCKLTEAQRHVA